MDHQPDPEQDPVGGGGDSRVWNGSKVVLVFVVIVAVIFGAMLLVRTGVIGGDPGHQMQTVPGGQAGGGVASAR